MPSQKRLRLVALLGFVLSVVVSGVGLLFLLQTLFAHRLSLASFTENGVTVEIALERESADRTYLAATFAPTDANFHLYSKDLARNGVDGMGRPTLLETISSDRIQPTGLLVADQSPTDYLVGVTGYPFPVYAHNPVTLRLPVTLSERDLFIPAELSVTYMACSRDQCLVPVMDKHVPVIIPGTMWRK